MKVIIQPDSAMASRLAAEMVADQVIGKPTSILGLATGSTPAELYRLLIDKHRRGLVDFSRITTFNPDEFVGIPLDHPASYHTFMRKALFEPLELAERRCHVPDGSARHLMGMIEQYERGIERAGGIDLQILGLGDDGHLAANDPGSSLASRMRLVPLTLAKRGYLAKAFGGHESIPRQAVTLGLANFLETHACIVLAFGESKADAVSKMVEGPLSALVPASVLQQHPDVIVIIDEPASSRLQLVDYYREAWLGPYLGSRP
jgi:glucosamine-6-phosphate deaminase